MKLLDVLAGYDGIDADIVLMTTYTLDPVFFESRLLRSRALAEARRIVVLVDAGEWERSLQLDRPARWLNFRHLVVPVRSARGVFHPKVTLMLGSDQCRLLCGSSNVTQAGYAYNLELHNRFSLEIDDDSPPSRASLLASAVEFFRDATGMSASPEALLARTWLDEAATNWGFARAPMAPERDGVRFVHTIRGGLWPMLETAWNERPPEELLVVSPFYDSDHELLSRVKKRWPECVVRIVAQQRTSLFDARKAEAVLPGILIESLDFKGRRLHAKLLAWRSGTNWACLAGSANFTSAAMDGRNAEACLWMPAASEMIVALFDEEMRPTRISAAQFIPGETLAPEDAEPTEARALRITTAVLDNFGSVTIGYQSALEPPPDEIIVAFRGANDLHAAWTSTVPSQVNGKATIRIPRDGPLSLAASVRVSLVGEALGKRFESLPVWLVHESKLTYEPSGDGGSDRQRNVRESGRGLPEYIDELVKTAGAAAAIEYLESLNIRFFDGQRGTGARKFVLTPRDPFRPDVPPEWLLVLSGAERKGLARAIIEFADRHERGRILRHARRGNINGIENFLDIVLCVARLLFIFYRRGVLTDQEVLERLKRCVALATTGTELQKPNDPGYLGSLAVNLKGDKATMKSKCDETGVGAILRAVLLLAQYVRSRNPDGQPGGGVAELLGVWRRKLSIAMEAVGASAPTPEQTTSILRELGVLSENELVMWSGWLSNEAERRHSSASA